MTNNQTGQKIEGTVELSAQETIRYRELTTDEERKTFEAELAPKYAAQLADRQVPDHCHERDDADVAADR